jgi:hypothetical protein
VGLGQRGNQNRFSKTSLLLYSGRRDLVAAGRLTETILENKELPKEGPQ